MMIKDLIEIARTNPELIKADQDFFYEIVHEHFLYLAEFAFQNAVNRPKMKQMLVHTIHKAFTLKEKEDE